MVELFRLSDGQLLPVDPDDEGRVHCEALDVHLRTVDGPRLAVTWQHGSAEI